MPFLVIFNFKSGGDGELNRQLVKGGTNDLSNLTILDQQSHRGKGNYTANHTPPFKKSDFNFTLDQYLNTNDINK